MEIVVRVFVGIAVGPEVGSAPGARFGRLAEPAPTSSCGGRDGAFDMLFGFCLPGVESGAVHRTVDGFAVSSREESEPALPVLASLGALVIILISGEGGIVFVFISPEGGIVLSNEGGIVFGGIVLSNEGGIVFIFISREGGIVFSIEGGMVSILVATVGVSVMGGTSAAEGAVVVAAPSPGVRGTFDSDMDAIETILIISPSLRKSEMRRFNIL